MLHRAATLGLGLCLSALTAAIASAAPSDHFESPPVHPLALTPNETRLLAVNTADHRLSVFDLTQGPVPVLIAEVPVGLEPVTVRAQNDSLVWVVNHISDSISLVSLNTFNVTATLFPGDEPTDVAFAGGKAFVVVSQEDRIQVYDAADPSVDLGGISLDVSDPRSVAVSKNGDRVFVTALDSGNRTTVVPADVVADTLGAPTPVPAMDPNLPVAPDVALIVKQDGAHWIDEIARSWDFAIGYTLPDDDVVAIDVLTQTVAAAYKGVGTTLFNVAVDPVSGKLFVSNQEAANAVRFEPVLKGSFVKNRVTVIDPGPNTVSPAHLNDHVNYGNPAGSAAERAASLSIPLDVLVNGSSVYVAAYGSDRVGVLDHGGVVQRRIPVGRGPSGLALGGPLGRLYVLNRIDGTVSTVNLSDDSSTVVSLGFDPTTEAIREGRHLFYNGENASAHGDVSCASCHVFGGFDNMSWDLGDPQGAFAPAPPNQPGSSGFHPMKGPMLTQSLKGTVDTEPLHWRGDREDIFAFNGAFVSLQGRSAELDAGAFSDFAAFVRSMRYPPNPFRNMDDSLPDPPTGPNPTTGEQMFMTGALVGAINCVDCHAMPAGENGLIIFDAAIQESQDMLVPQLRGLYERTRFDNTAATTVRGFGFTHDGAVDDLVSFLEFSQFEFTNDDERRDMEAFLLAFDSGTPSAVGVQWTMDGTNEAAGIVRLNTLLALADSDVIGLIGKGRNAYGENRGWVYQGSGIWLSDRESEGTAATQMLLDAAGPGTEITFTAVLEGCGQRLGIDRDEDGYRDRDELDAGSNPGNPLSTPQTVSVGDGGDRAVAGWLRVSPNPVQAGAATIRYSVIAPGPVGLSVFDLQGRLVNVLTAGEYQAEGEHAVRWGATDAHGRSLPGGVYFVRLTAKGSQASQRIVVLD